MRRVTQRVKRVNASATDSDKHEIAGQGSIRERESVKEVNYYTYLYHSERVNRVNP